MDKKVIFHILDDGSIKISTEGEISNIEFLGVLKHAENLGFYTSLKDIKDGVNLSLKGTSSVLEALKGISQMVLATFNKKGIEEDKEK